HLNGLIRLETGSVTVDGIDLTAKKPDLKLLRRKVGMVFQYPESQLFADTVFKDVIYGPKNMKKTPDECLALARSAMELTGLEFDAFKDRSPFELSGGEKRRAAIAGVIACEPEYLIMDEPSAGLDPKGKEDIYRLVGQIKARTSPTVIIISHDIDEITQYADRIAVFGEGKIFADFKTRDIAKYADILRARGLDVPLTVKLCEMLRARGLDIDEIKPDGFISEVIGAYRRKNGEGGL
ncbi:MAG: ATP-binding cassette domain-containing protein, partial [Clostridiales bacterium]|nr:ATP-binding cassette domain-containing protein [Clostridiales bacterium]